LALFYPGVDMFFFTRTIIFQLGKILTLLRHPRTRISRIAQEYPKDKERLRYLHLSSTSTGKPIDYLL